MQLSPLLPPTSFWIQPVCSSLSWSVFLSKERVLLGARKDTDRRRAREDPTRGALAKRGRSGWSRPLVTSWGHQEAARTPLLLFSRRFLSWLYTLGPCFGALLLLLLLGEQGPRSLRREAGTSPLMLKTSSSMASAASSSLPKTQGCRTICSDGVNPEGARQAFVPFPWKLRRAASSHFGGTKGRLAGPTSPAGELGHRAGRPHPHRQEPPLSFLDVSGELGLQFTAAFPGRAFGKLNIFKPILPPSDRFIPGKLCLLLQL